jgi:hypothetical protein
LCVRSFHPDLKHHASLCPRRCSACNGRDRFAEDKKPETPAEGVSAILAYLEKDDLAGLFLNRYGELDRFAKTDEEKKKIVGEMVQKMEKHKAAMLDAWKKAKGVEQEIVEQNGEKVAVFKLEKGTAKLYLKNGIWTFHL